MLRVTCTKHETVTTHDLAFESPCEFDELITCVRTVAPESDYPDLYLGGQRLPALQAACHTQPPARPPALDTGP